VTAAERDELVLVRDKSDIALECSESKVADLKSALEEERAQIHELTSEHNAIHTALQVAAKTASEREREFRVQLDGSLAENAKLRERTNAGESEKTKHLHLEILKNRAETERLDAENADPASPW